jgi:hypothetical protein
MQVLSLYEFSYIIAFCIGFMHFHAPTRQKMMIMKVFACLFAVIYFWGVGAHTAVYAAIISGLGGLIQALFADHHLERTRLLRASAAIFLAVMAICLSASSTLEALPLIATICSRLCEVQACKQRIRMGYIISQSLWITYAISSGLIILYIAENLNMLSNLFAIWRHERVFKKAVPVMIRSS